MHMCKQVLTNKRRSTSGDDCDRVATRCSNQARRGDHLQRCTTQIRFASDNTRSTRKAWSHHLGLNHTHDQHDIMVASALREPASHGERRSIVKRLCEAHQTPGRWARPVKCQALAVSIRRHSVCNRPLRDARCESVRLARSETPATPCADGKRTGQRSDELATRAGTYVHMDMPPQSAYSGRRVLAPLLLLLPVERRARGTGRTPRTCSSSAPSTSRRIASAVSRCTTSASSRRSHTSSAQSKCHIRS